MECDKSKGSENIPAALYTEETFSHMVLYK